MNQQFSLSGGLCLSRLLWALCGTCLTGLVWRSASRILGYPEAVSHTLLLVAGVLLAALVLFSAVQVVRNPEPLVSAFSDPDPRGSILLLPGICLVLLSIGARSLYEPGARLAFILGTCWQMGAVAVYLHGARMRFIDEGGVDALQMFPGLSLMLAAMAASQFQFPAGAWLLFASGFLMVLPLWLMTLQQCWLNRSMLRAPGFLLAPPALVYLGLVGVNGGDAGTVGLLGLFGALALVPLFLAAGRFLFSEAEAPARWGMCMGLSILAMALMLFRIKSEGILPSLVCDGAVVAASFSWIYAMQATWAEIAPRS